MASTRQFRRWSISSQDLTDLTPATARELVTRCFLEAQRETFARSRRSVGLETQDQDVERSVRGAVRAVFHEVGADYERPSKQELLRVVDVLASRAAAWGTPEDVVEYHTRQLGRLFKHLQG
jgi:hypothetical protein